MEKCYQITRRDISQCNIVYIRSYLDWPFVVSGPQDLNAFYWQFVLVWPCYGSDR